jgi:hypothetical protein
MQGKEALIFLFVISLSGCGEEEPRSVEWYQEHPDERQAKLAVCKNAQEESANCENARTAQRLATTERTPLNW